jgi:hypothetical protein
MRCADAVLYRDDLAELGTSLGSVRFSDGGGTLREVRSPRPGMRTTSEGVEGKR